MPTFTFFSYLLCLFAVYLFRSSYRGWFGQYLLWVMLAVPVLVLLLSLPAMILLKMEIRNGTHVFKDAKGEIKLTFHSLFFLPVGRVRLRFRAENRYTGEVFRSDAVYFNISDETIPFPIPSGHCGKICFRVVRWDCRDLLSFFSLPKKLPPAVSCIVLPNANAPEKKPDLDECLNRNAVFKPKPGGGFSEEYDLREYRPGDTVSSIHWKLSSKTDRLIVREALERENHRIFVVLLSDGENNDRALEVLHWLSCELLKRELPHTVVSHIQYSVTNERECLEALREILSFPASPPCAFDTASARCVFFISDGEVSVQ